LPGEITAVIANSTEVLNFVVSVGSIFTQWPFVLVPIVAMIAVGYKYGIKVFNWIKGKWG